MVGKKKPKTKDEIQADIEEASNALEFNLGDIEGIGPAKQKKLEEHGLHSPSDLIVKGPRELSEILGMPLDAVTKITESAKRFLQKKDIVGKTTLSARDLLNFQTKTKFNLTTGVPEFDEILGDGYESGVITELYGKDGSGKTQACIVACLEAQRPYKMKCFKCKKVYDDQTQERCTECEVKTYKVGGLSETGKQCRVIYLDTEGSFDPRRALEIIYERELVPVKEQAKSEIGKVPKEPLDEESIEKALCMLDNIVIKRPKSSAEQLLQDEELGKYIKGEPGEEKAKLLIVDSLTGAFRLDYTGRGDLSDRQNILKKHIKHLSRLADVYNVVLVMTNQVLQDPGAGPYVDPTKPIGGLIVGHTSKHRIYLRAGGVKEGNRKVTAILQDSPNHSIDECTLQLTGKGIEYFKSTK